MLDLEEPGNTREPQRKRKGILVSFGLVKDLGESFLGGYFSIEGNVLIDVKSKGIVV